MTQEQPTFTISQVAVSFWGNKVLTGVDLAFKPGFNGLIGPNGAGKTTLFNVISGYVTPSAGTIKLGERDITGFKPTGIARAGIARTFQAPKLIMDETVLENTLLGRHHKFRWGHLAELMLWGPARAEERHAREICMEALDRFGLADRAHDKAESLPLGSQKLVEVARAFAGEPDVVLLDEPAAGLGASDVDVMLTGFQSYTRARPITFVIIEHDLELVSSLCHTISALDYGKIIASGSPAEVTSNRTVIEAYLGAGFTREQQHKTAVSQ